MSGHVFLTAEQAAELKKEDALVVLIDADIPCYSVGFSCENESNWFMVQKTVDNFMMKIIRETQATHLIGFLTDGAANYRVNDAVTFKYKGNRTGTKKPKWYKKIRSYLQTHWLCQVMVGIEADDALAIAQEYFSGLGIHNVMATLDKDLNQVVGWKYNWKYEKDALYYMDEQSAHRSLWKQVIIGDVSTDNIPGLSHSAWKPNHSTMVPSFETEMRIPREPKILKNGKPSTRKMAHAKLVGYVEVAKEHQRALQEDTYGETRADALLNEWDPQDYPENILNEYAMAYYEEGLIQGYDDPLDYCIKRYEETFRLVYMLRTVDEIPNSAKLSLVPHRAEIVELNEFDDDVDSMDPLSDFDDDDF